MAIQFTELREIVGTGRANEYSLISIVFIRNKQMIFRFPDVAFHTSFKLNIMNIFQMPSQILLLTKIVVMTNMTTIFSKQLYHGNDSRKNKKEILMGNFLAGGCL